MYAIESDLQKSFGVKNIQTWSTLENSDDSDSAARITEALEYADGLMNDVMRDSAYVIPLSFNSTGSAAVIRRIACWLAAEFLYSSRGLRVDDTVGQWLKEGKEEQLSLLMKYKSNELRLDSPRKWSYAPTAPAVVGGTGLQHPRIAPHNEGLGNQSGSVDKPATAVLYGYPV